MNTQTHFKSMEKMLGFLFVLLAALALSSCSLIIDKMQAKQSEEFNRMMEDRNRILQSLLPDGMTYKDVPLSSVLDEISKMSGLEIKPWKDEGDRKVTLDMSSMTIEEAIKAVLLYVDSEGAVLIRQKYFLHHSWGQYWPWGYPPTR